MTHQWQQDVYDVLRAGGVRQVAYVPDGGHAHAIKQAVADPDVHDVVLTTEEEGVGVVAGAWLGGERAVLLMQSSGVGNCVNAFSLLESCRLPFLAVVTMRGDFAEFNPWQSPMGRRTQAALELIGIRVHRVDVADDVADVLGGALESTFLAGERNAVLLGQRLLGRKSWEK